MRNIKHKVDQLTAYENVDFGPSIHNLFDQTELTGLADDQIKHHPSKTQKPNSD